MTKYLEYRPADNGGNATVHLVDASGDLFLGYVQPERWTMETAPDAKTGLTSTVTWPDVATPTGWGMARLHLEEAAAREPHLVHQQRLA